MRIALCRTKPSDHGEMLLSAVGKGIALHGDRQEWLSSERDALRLLPECTAAVMICSPNRHQSPDCEAVRLRNAVDAECRRLGKRILMIDTGYVRNDLEWKRDNPGRHIRQSAAEAYLGVGWDGIKRHGDCGVAIGDAMPDRWRELGVTMLPWRVRRPAKRLLLIGQTHNGASTQDVVIGDWYGQALAACAQDGKCRILYRPHPRMRSHRGRWELDRDTVLRRYGVAYDIEVSEESSLEADLDKVDAVVCYSSNAAVTSVLTGIPTVVGHDICMARDVAGHDLSAIDDYRTCDREPWAHRLAWAQWTCDEMASGAMWSHFRKFAKLQRRSEA